MNSAGVCVLAAAALLGCGGSSNSGSDGAVPSGDAAAELYQDVSATHLAFPVLAGFTMDAASGDFDGDGDNDLILAMEFAPNLLLINPGDGRFELADASRLPQDVHDSEDLGVADFDDDGDLDVVVVSEDDEVNELYLNDGSANFVAAGGNLPVTGVSNGVAVADVNGDGLPDILIANNGQNRLLINSGSAVFVDETATRLPTLDDVSQDVEFGDADGDGDLDIVVGNEDENRLLINNGSGVFADESSRLPSRAGVEETREADFGDFDSDGDLDLFFANVDLFAPGAEPQNRLLLNDGAGNYDDQSESRLPADNDLSFDGDFIDLDGDGRLDIATSNGLRGGQPYRAYRNTGAEFVDATSEIFSSDPRGNGFDIEPFDADGDGDLDLYLAGRQSADFLLLRR